MIILKTILDGWNLSKNFGGPIGKCPFCDSDAGEHLAHFMNCTVASVAFNQVVYSRLLPRHNFLFIPFGVVEVDEVARLAAHTAALYHSFSYSKHSRFTLHVYSGYLFKLCRDSKTIQEACHAIV